MLFVKTSNLKASAWLLHAIRFTTCFFILLTTNLVFAQNLPTVIPPSPSAASLFKFQDYPMDHSTGLPQIVVPVYEIKSGSLSLPISLSYHASGRKVYDQDGAIALGWTLNAGGMISRTIHGSADFGTYKFPYPFQVTGLTNQYTFPYLQKIAHSQITDCNIFPWTDSEYDIFSYSVGSMNGKFIFKDDNNVKTPVLIPLKPYRVNPLVSGAELIGFEMVDDKGVNYYFGGTERVEVNGFLAYTGWSISRIVSADKVDTINFQYGGGVEERLTRSQSRTITDQWWVPNVNFDPPPNPDTWQTVEHTNSEIYQTTKLLSISFRGGKINFSYVGNGDKLNTIQIVDRQSSILRTVEFNRSVCYSQAELSAIRYQLNSILFKDNSNILADNYTFEYYPLVSEDSQVDIKYCDYWGYYNDSRVTEMIPQYTNIPYDLPYYYINTQYYSFGHTANRNPNLEAKKTGVLKKITYPTGGQTEFVYENNMYLNPTTNLTVAGPGLRIQKILTYEKVGDIPNVRTFKYGTSESGAGTLALIPDISNMAVEKRVAYHSSPSFHPDLHKVYRQRTFFSGFVPQLNELANRPIFYPEVTEYHGTEADNSGKTIYTFTAYSDAEGGLPSTTSIPIRHISTFDYLNVPAPEKTTIYKSNRSVTGNNYVRIKETTNTYSTTISETILGLHLQRVYETPQTGYGSVYRPDLGVNKTVCSEEFTVWGNYPANYYGQGTQVFSFAPYQIYSGYRNLTNVVEIEFNSDGSKLSNTTSYTYNAKQLPETISTINSDGSIQSSTTSYAFQQTSVPVLQQMTNLNMVAFPVEQAETKNSTIPIKKINTAYKDWNQGGVPRIYQESIAVTHGSSAQDTRIRFHGYDNSGNITEVSKENDIKKVYIWGYQNTYPVAEVTGISYSQAISVLNTQLLGSPGSDQVLRDELNKIRTTYPTAHCTTFTYKPLVGVTSQTDPAGRTTYFEYDGHGRLKLIRDKDLNIIKSFKYQYQGTSAN